MEREKTAFVKVTKELMDRLDGGGNPVQPGTILFATNYPGAGEDVSIVSDQTPVDVATLDGVWYFQLNADEWDPVPLVTEEHLLFLDDLRESGETNMFGAGPYVMNEFGVDRKEARAIVLFWMNTYGARHPRPIPSEPTGEVISD